MKRIISILPLLVFAILASAQLKRNAVRPTTVQNPSTKPAVVPLKAPEKPAPIKQQSVKVSPEVSGRYEFSKRMNDGTTIKQIFQLQENKIASFKNNRMAASSKIKKMPRNATHTTNDIAAGTEECTTEETILSVDNIAETTVDYSGQAAYIYPGAVYKFDNFMKGGWNDINVGRNPITLVASVSNTGTEKPTEKIESPNQASIANAKNVLYNRFTTHPKKISNEGFQFRLYEVSNEAEIALKLGASGYGFGVKASGLINSTDKKSHHYLLIDATKSMFSISVMPEPSGIMQNPAADMMYISNVVYGSRIIAVAEIETYQSGMDVKFSAGADYLVAGGDFNLDYIAKEFGSTTKINFYVVGGQSDKISSVYSFYDLKMKTDEILKTLNYHTSLPISYTLKNMSNNIVSKYSATDYFLSQSCILRKKDEAPKDIEVSASIHLSQLDNTETDIEIFGQVWAQLFTANGKEILPVGAKDRLMDLKDNQHLVKSSFYPYYAPQVSPHFIIPGSSAAGCKLIVYYWLMDDDDKPNDDDFLSMRNGNGTMRRYKNDNYYATEINLDKSLTNLPCSEFVDRDSESGVKACLIISKTIKK